jgi:hypothetical protein
MRLRTLAPAILLVCLAGCAAGQPTPPSAPPVGRLGPDDGFLAVGETVSLTDELPAITNLDATLRDALDRAEARSEIHLTFTNAWRSPRYQQYLFDEAVAEYGSEGEALRWVLPPDRSEHVAGRAVDVATADAMDWLNRFGAEFGLCQIYANERWHFEYVDGVTEVCPEQLLDGSAG